MRGGVGLSAPVMARKAVSRLPVEISSSVTPSGAPAARSRPGPAAPVDAVAVGDVGGGRQARCGRRRGAHLGGRPVGDDAALRDQHDPVGEGRRPPRGSAWRRRSCGRRPRRRAWPPRTRARLTSMPAVGSSRTSRSGSGTSARAKRSRCCSPPEHLETMRPLIPARPARWSSSSTGRRRVSRPATSSTVSRTVRSRSSPPDWSTAETRPATTARPRIGAVTARCRRKVGSGPARRRGWWSCRRRSVREVPPPRRARW